MARAATTKGQTRIQREKTELILDAALEVFSTYGYRGSTLDQIADADLILHVGVFCSWLFSVEASIVCLLCIGLVRKPI